MGCDIFVIKDIVAYEKEVNINEKEVTIYSVDHEYDFNYQGKIIRVSRFNCSPSIEGRYQLLLLISNPNYINIREQLIRGKTFNINVTCYDRLHAIINTISPAIKRTTQDKVRDILSLKDELYQYNDPNEIVIEDFNDRLICGDKIKALITPGKIYKFTYIKDFGDSKYRILDAEEYIDFT